MANGYLGKISAVVSANTADFQAKLNASANDVRSFAKSVQSNLTSASREAARSFESIYTPLQKFERSLQAAASMKLSFKGFAGALKDVDVLRQRLGSMKDSQVSLAVRASGLKNVTELKEALVGLRAKDLSVVAKVGGLEKVRELRALSAEKRVDFAINLLDSGFGRRLAEAQSRVSELKDAIAAVKAGGGLPDGGASGLAAEYREATAEVKSLQDTARQTIKTTLGINVQKDADVDRILQAGERAEGIRLPVILDVLGEAAVKEAVTQAQQIRSVAESINKPFADATQKIAGMSAEVQAGFLPAMKRSQSQVESLKANIEKSVLPASSIAQQFDVVEKRVSAAVAAVNRLAEASSKVNAMKTGRELAFTNPRLSETLDRGVSVGNRAAGLPASAIQANPRIAGILEEISTLSNKAVAAYAGLQRRFSLGLPTDSAQKSADALQARLDALFAEFDATYQIHVDAEAAKKQFADLTVASEKLRDQTNFVVTGRPQTLEQADARRASLNSEVSNLDRSQRQNIKPLLQDADAARALGDVDKVNDALDKIEAKVSKAKAYNVTFEKAKKDANDLKATMDSLKDDASFVIAAKVQNAGQAEAEIKRIVRGLEQLDAAQRTALQPKVDAAISSLGTKDIAVISAAVKDLDDEFEKERVIKVKTDEAKKSVDSLKESLASIADKIGDPSQPIDRLRKAVDAANAAIAKMPAGAIKTKLEGDLNSAKASIEAASKPGSPIATAKGIDSAATSINAIAAAATAATPAKATANPLGADFGTAERGYASLQANVMSLQSSLERLPLPMQTKFIPAINKVRDEFQKLTLSSTKDEIDAVVTKAKALEGAFTRAGQAAKFGGMLGEALNAAAITKTEKQLGFIRAKLLEVGATASGPVANAFNAYSAAAEAAANDGVLGTAAVTKQLDGLIAKIGEALVAEGKLTAAQGKAFSKSVGDVGREGADKFALALNQAAFAVDDFMSSTGGLEFKLRAVSNNITQLAFILGGTTGLFVGLGAVIAGQAAVGLIKWMNNGRSAEDQTKALNEALARQKSLVEELAQAFESLGDAMSRGTFSAGGEQAAEFSRQMEDIKNKQKESREGRVADLDTNVQVERAEQVKLKSELEKSTDPSERVVLQRRIDASEFREKDAAKAAVDRTVMPDEARTRIREARERVRLAELDPRGNDIRTFEAKAQETRDQVAREVESVPVGNSAADIRAQQVALEKELQELSEKSRNAGRFFFPDDGANAARDAAIPLEQTLRGLELPLRLAIDDAANGVAEASRGPAAQIRQAQEDVAEAIRKGVPNAAAFQRELDASATKLKDAYAALEQAQKETDPTKKQAKVDEAQKRVDEVEGQQADIARRSREVRLGRTFGGERATAALSSLQGSDRFRNESAGQIARLSSAIDSEIAARQKLEAATAKGVEAEIKAAEAELAVAQRASEAAAAIAEAAMSIESAMTRVRKIGDSALQRSEQGADAAQQSYTNSPLRAGAKEARDAAEYRLINDRAKVGNAQADLSNRRSQIQSDPRMVGINDELETITQRRKDLEAKRATSGGLNLAERDDLGAASRREIELIRQREMAARDLTADEQKQLDVINSRIAAREKELDASRRRSEQSPEFSRIQSQAEGALGEANRRADEAQQRFANNPTDENKQRRDEAEDNLRKRQSSVQRFQDMADAQRKQTEASPEFQQNNKELQQIAARRAQIAENSAGRAMTAGEIGELTGQGGLLDRERELRNKNEGLMQQGLEPFRNAIDEAQSRDALLARADRGRDLGMTASERFRKEFTEGAGADINARAKELRDQGQDPAAFLRQAVRNQLESVAPMLQQFQEERQNAFLQGPSRAALNVSDVSTTQGQSELNRLLRGDDSAKDVNLAELQKQSAKLDEVVKAIREANPGVLL